MCVRATSESSIQNNKFQFDADEFQQAILFSMVGAVVSTSHRVAPFSAKLFKLAVQGEIAFALVIYNCSTESLKNDDLQCQVALSRALPNNDEQQAQCPGL